MLIEKYNHCKTLCKAYSNYMRNQSTNIVCNQNRMIHSGKACLQAVNYFVYIRNLYFKFMMSRFLKGTRSSASQGQVVIDNILEPLQSHFKRYEPQTLTNEPCIGVNEHPESNNELDEKEKKDKKKLYEECPYKVSCKWICFPSCCNGLVYFNFNDFHWVRPVSSF